MTKHLLYPMGFFPVHSGLNLKWWALDGVDQKGVSCSSLLSHFDEPSVNVHHRRFKSQESSILDRLSAFYQSFLRLILMDIIKALCVIYYINM